MIRGTEKKFGFEWDEYREILPLHERQFRQWISPIEISFFKGKSFLDAGCGIGRNSLWALKAGASSALAFDFDERTVDVAKKNLAAFPNCRVEYKSIYDFSDVGEFDIVFCIGVIHHLRHPERAIGNLVRALKPKGTLIIWVYAYEGNERYLKFMDPVRRYFTSKVHPAVARYISKLFTLFLKLYLMFPTSSVYLNELKQRSFRHTEAMVFDQLLPHISHYWRRDEVLNLVKGLPVNVKHVTHTNGMSWTLVAEKL